jgi:DNA-binding response OmpR family regulator
VLVVDDDPGIRRIIEILLQKNGYTVQTAPNGQEALEVLDTVVPDVMVLDVMMPGMSGFEVCKAVRTNKRLQSVPVVFLTAKGTPQDYKAGQDAGGVVYMVKPFRPERLLQVVRLFCRTGTE